MPDEETPVGRLRAVKATALLEALRSAPSVDAERLKADLDAIVDQDPAPRA